MAGLTGGQIKPLDTVWKRRFTCLSCGYRVPTWERFLVHRKACGDAEAQRQRWEEARAGD